MKTRKIKGLIASLFTLAMAVSVATTMAVTRQQKLPEIVLAEDVEDPETPVSNEDEAPAQPADDSIASEGQESASEESKAETPSFNSRDIFKIIIQIFKDALKDLMAHFEKWLNS